MRERSRRERGSGGRILAVALVAGGCGSAFQAGDVSSGDGGVIDASQDVADVTQGNDGTVGSGDSGSGVDGGLDTGKGPADSGSDSHDASDVHPGVDAAADAGCPGAAASTLPLDAVLGATAGYGLRNLRKNYTGPLVRLVRSSDHMAKDFPADGNGEFPTAEAAFFAATSSLTVQIWYDQSTHDYDISQGTATNQPAFKLNAYGTHPVVKFTYDDQTYLTAVFPWITGNGPSTTEVTILGDVAAQGAYQPIVAYGAPYTGLTDNNALFLLAEVNNAFDYAFSWYGTDFPSGIATSAPVAYSFAYDGGSGNLNVNGSTFSEPFNQQNIGDAATGEYLWVGGWPSQSGRWLNASLGDILLYPTALSDSQVAQLQCIDRAYYGF